MAGGWEGTLALSPAVPSQRGTVGASPAARPAPAMLPRGSEPAAPAGPCRGDTPARPEPTKPAQPSPCPVWPAAPPSGDTAPCPRLRGSPGLWGDSGTPERARRGCRAPRGGGAPGWVAGWLSLPVPGRWPIDGGAVSRLGTGPASKCPCPCWQPGGPEHPGQHPGTPPAPAPPACSSPGRGGSSPGKCLWVLFIAQAGDSGMMSPGRALAGAGAALTFSSAVLWRG